MRSITVNAPVEHDQFLVDSNGRSEPSRSDSFLELCEQGYATNVWCRDRGVISSVFSSCDPKKLHFISAEAERFINS